MTLQHVDIVFQLIVFLLAISVHESAHAWMANRLGDRIPGRLIYPVLGIIKFLESRI